VTPLQSRCINTLPEAFLRVISLAQLVDDWHSTSSMGWTNRHRLCAGTRRLPTSGKSSWQLMLLICCRHSRFLDQLGPASAIQCATSKSEGKNCGHLRFSLDLNFKIKNYHGVQTASASPGIALAGIRAADQFSYAPIPFFHLLHSVFDPFSSPQFTLPALRLQPARLYPPSRDIISPHSPPDSKSSCCPPAGPSV
jgi:hypothetical protein